ncbi:phage tail assembly protein T [Photobacterium ganghwense]|uniref:phage tail assembly protein T n=1 Tax=Photobacterium ganghwense TaxID=320778 RepID=UPI001C2D2553|nr:phage tail assembly protein T [Photobacterium ganghwense]MBV1842705.1 phage tail assembly protein T [Photobacterium ganghwense]
MLATISAETLLEWREYYAEHGFAHQMDNWRFATATAANWNITAMSAGVKMDTPVSPSDFLPSTGDPEPPRELTDEELMDLGASAGGMRFECPDS